LFTALHNLVHKNLPSLIILLPIRIIYEAFVIFGSNVMVEWLTLLLSIRDVLASNLGPGIGYPD
jgi:hypothetical protein